MTLGSLSPGTVVAGYRLERFIGRGGMGVVYEATQLSLNRTVAVKIVSPHLGEDRSFRTRFQREGTLQASLDHPNIVTIHEAGEFEGTMFIAMRLVRGTSLKEIIQLGELDAERGLRILAPVADALDSAHGAGLIHRDVKPHNILVGRGDHPYLADFGVAKSLSSTEITRSGHFVGSLDYLSPEQIRGEPVTAASDIYSLGAVLFECLTGVVPFPKDSEAALLYAHVAEPPPAVTGQRPGLPAGLNDVIAQAMAKDPDARFASASELVRHAEATFSVPTRTSATTPVSAAAEDHAAAEAGRTTHAAPPPSAPSTTARRQPPKTPPVVAAPRRRVSRRVGLGVAFAIAALLVLGAGFAFGSSGSVKKTTKTPTSTASARSLALRVPASWTNPGSLPPVPGLSVGGGVARFDRASSGEMFAGTIRDASGPLLLPAAFERKLAISHPVREAVRLGAVDAYRYRGLTVHGSSGKLTLLVIPTSGGVQGIGCRVPGGDAATFSAACEQAAATVRLVGVTALPLGPDAGYGRRLSTTLRTLGRADARSAAVLMKARTRRDQAGALAALGSAQATAARTLQGVHPPPDAVTLNARLAFALQAVDRQYAALSSAARSGNARRYAMLRPQVADAQATVQTALTQLRSIGYR